MSTVATVVSPSCGGPTLPALRLTASVVCGCNTVTLLLRGGESIIAAAETPRDGDEECVGSKDEPPLHGCCKCGVSAPLLAALSGRRWAVLGLSDAATTDGTAQSEVTTPRGPFQIVEPSGVVEAMDTSICALCDVFLPPPTKSCATGDDPWLLFRTSRRSSSCI